jgi:hypothetical protein
MERSRQSWLSGVVLGGLYGLTAGPLLAAVPEVSILVANKDTPAAAAAAAKADGKTVFAESRLFKAIDKAAEIIGAKKHCPQARVKGMEVPPCTLTPEERYLVVNIKVASGEYQGKGGKGGFSIPEINEPDTTLRILGGYDDKFEKRAPFTTPTVLPIAGTVFEMQGKNHALKEFYLSGFVMDIGGGNQYDGKTNSLLKGTSASVQAVTIGYLETERLVYADNVFLNSSHKAAAPLVRAANDKAEVLVRNNFILNNVLSWEADSARFKTIPASYTFENNSFLVNWPFNPDPTTAQPAALQLNGKYATGKFVIKRNIFAHNPGGAILWTAPTEKDGPVTEIVENLFFGNGTLFSETAPGAAAVVTKMGGFKSQDIPWNVIGMDVLEDFNWKSDKNVALDPKVPIVLVKPGFANSASVSAANTTLNDVRGMFGMNKQGGKVQISNFAPRMGVDPKNFPFPAEGKAKEYGVNPAKVEQF